MDPARPDSPHAFHIPVMGTAFTIETPLAVARYGISSVVSLVDDVLVEQMREQVARRFGREHVPIGPRDEDSRARRITDYLDLLDGLVKEQTERLRQSAFEAGSEITRYFEMLPPGPLRTLHDRMRGTADGAERARLERDLRERVVPGAIDVNIMTKVDRHRKGTGTGDMFSDALSSLRGFAKSRLRSSVILSAGLNLRLFSYLAEFEDFVPDALGRFRKGIILKVGDLRSAATQGKVLARKGLWVSEFRLESGLNCGGHAFGGKGRVLGPILEEFRRERERLAAQLHGLLNRARVAAGLEPLAEPPPQRLTVQGGIGTAEEREMLHDVYGVDGTGWGSPFLLVPDVVRIDPDSLRRVREAEEEDVVLGRGSPLGVPFWSLRSSSSERVRRDRIASGRPGSPCPKGFLSFDTEFTRSQICTASRVYQRRKLRQIDDAGLAAGARADARAGVLEKACLCRDLAGGAAEPDQPDVATLVCCGPNTVYYSRVSTLPQMVDHIYGRGRVPVAAERPHVFLKELGLHLGRLREDLQRAARGLGAETEELRRETLRNLLEGIDHYRERAACIVGSGREDFLAALEALHASLRALGIEEPVAAER